MFEFIKNLFKKEKIPERTLEHSSKGDYTKNSNRLKNGGHGQEALNYMDKHGIKYNITKTYSNGVRIGNVPNHKNRLNTLGDNQCWFPKNWDRKTIKKAGQKVAKGERVQEGKNKEGKYKRVVVAIKRRGGAIVTIFPVKSQILTKKRGKK